MITETIKELETAKAKLAELETMAQKQSTEALSSLPGKYGFSTVEEFIAALKEAAPKRRGRKAKKSAAAPTKSRSKGRTRARITPEMKEQLKTMVGDGKTGAEVAKSLGISLPSVQNIKKELGLVKQRGK